MKQEDKCVEREARSTDAHRRHRLAMAIRGLVPAILAGLLAACGGGGDSGPVGPTTGRVYPAAAGLVFTELDPSGRVLQRSSASGADGRFTFKHPLRSGVIEARFGESVAWRAGALASAQVDMAAAEVVVSPLSTAAERMSGPSEAASAARGRVKDWVRAACGDAAAALVDETLLPSSQGKTHSRAAIWVEHAVAGYLGALRELGLGPDSPDTAWQQALAEHTPVLSRMCEVSFQLFSDAWIDEQARLLAVPMDRTPEEAREAIQEVHTSIVDRVLAMHSVLLARRVYPELTTGLAAPMELDNAREAELAARLLEARILAQSQDTFEASASSAELAATLIQDFDGSGKLVEAMSVVGQARDNSDWRFVLRNPTDTAQTFRFDINGGMTMNMGAVVEELLRLPSNSFEPLHVRAWRFINEQTRHAYPLSVGTYLHAPPLQLRSIGSGFCDDRASALHHLWQHLGYNSRVWSLDGHVVAEVEIDGRWQMYDPDLGVHYFDRNGGVASVADLAADPALVSSPVRRLPSAHRDAYSTTVEEIYRSSENNVVAEWLMAPSDDQFPEQWTLPPGAELHFAPSETFALPSVVAGETLQTATVRLVLPEGFAGRVPLPLLLGNVSGYGRISALRSEFELAGNDLAEPLHAFLNRTGSVSMTELQVDRVDAGGLTLTLLLSPVRITSTRSWEVRIESDSMAGLEASLTP